MGEPTILWCSVRAKDGLVPRCWRRNMPNATWNRICKNAIAVTHTIEVLDDFDRSSVTCFWCIKDPSP